MSRPDSVTNEDIQRWSNNIDQNNHLPKELIEQPLIREVCYAGFWLAEQLEIVNCPNILIGRILWTAGKLSFGKDIWQVHQHIFEEYKNDTLIFEEDPNEIKN